MKNGKGEGTLLDSIVTDWIIKQTEDFTQENIQKFSKSNIDNTNILEAAISFNGKRILGK